MYIFMILIIFTDCPLSNVLPQYEYVKVINVMFNKLVFFTGDKAIGLYIYST